MITLVVVYCLTVNPYMCRTLEMVPDDGRAIASIAECIKGGAIGGMSFTLEHAEWHVKGYRCQEKPTEVQAWLRDKSRGY
jgi:hypothetical protein